MINNYYYLTSILLIDTIEIWAFPLINVILMAAVDSFLVQTNNMQ